MAWAHSFGLGSDVVFRVEKLELTDELRDVLPVPNNKLDVEFVFDRQARPHLILTCHQLTGDALGVGRKPSFFDLPIELQASLLKRQTHLATELSALHAEVHLGSWVSSQHIHAHVVLTLLPYFALRASALGMERYGLAEVQRRAHYVEKTACAGLKFKNMDGPATHKAAVSGEPQRLANVSSFEALRFDADESGTAAIDMTFKNAPLIKNMSAAELCEALAAIRGLYDALCLDGAHLLFPAPALGDGAQLTGAHQERVARLVVRPDLFVLALPPERRLTWYNAWVQGDPRARTYKEDMSLLSHVPVEAGEGSSSSVAPQQGSPSVKRKLCKNFIRTSTHLGAAGMARVAIFCMSEGVHVSVVRI